MQGDLLTEFDFGSGARLALYTNRLVLHGGDAMESVPLTHLASVRVAFERDARKLNWAIGLLALALAFAVVSGPLQSWMMDLSSKVAPAAGRESLEAVLVAAFGAVARLARLMFPLALVLAAAAAALVVFFWIGHTTLTLSFAAAERAFPVRGRNHLLIQFAEAVADQLAAPRGGGGT
jgi:uncharacterized Tic20 family protein